MSEDFIFGPPVSTYPPKDPWWKSWYGRLGPFTFWYHADINEWGLGGKMMFYKHSTWLRLYLLVFAFTFEWERREAPGVA